MPAAAGWIAIHVKLLRRKPREPELFQGLHFRVTYWGLHGEIQGSRRLLGLHGEIQVSDCEACTGRSVPRGLQGEIQASRRLRGLHGEVFLPQCL